MIYQVLRHLKNQKGQGLVEYALIVALIAVVAVASIDAVGVQVKAIFESIKTSLLNA